MKGDFLTTAFSKIRSRIAGRHQYPDDEEDSQDALQEAFCRLWIQRDRIEERVQAEGMLATTVKNIRIDVYRKRTSHPKVDLAEITDPPEAPEDERQDVMDRYREIDRLVKKHLSARDREILYHRDKDGWEFDELAQHYDLSEANVRMIVSRARKTIREVYNQQKGERNGR